MKMIITADWHIRATKPRCRIDEDWMETQRKVLKQIVQISKEKEAPVFVVGDIFHSNSDTSFECICLIQEIADELGVLYILAGNHDLLYHSSENLNKSAIGVLLDSNNIRSIEQGIKYASASNFDEEDDYSAEIVFKHTLTLPEKNPLFDSETPESLLEKFPNAKWIFTGDYHHSFDVKINNRHVVNPGCILRQAADMKNYQSGVYFVDIDKDECEFIPIIDNIELIDDSYILKEQERDERLETFVNKLKDTKNVSLDFIDNVNNFLLQNKVDKDLKTVIEELINA